MTFITLAEAYQKALISRSPPQHRSLEATGVYERSWLNGIGAKIDEAISRGAVGMIAGLAGSRTT
jgi:hypothetical protein